MSEMNNGASSQPEAQAQTSDGGDKGSISVSQAIAQLAARAEAKQEQAAEAQVPEENSAPETPQEPQQESEAQEANEVAAEPKAEEAKTENAEESDSEEEDVLSKKAKLTPEQQEVFNKRLGKEVAKRKKAEERITELESRLNAPPVEEPKTQPIIANPNDPLGSVNDIQALSNEHKAAKEVLRLVEYALDNDDDPRWTDDKFAIDGTVYTKQQLKAAKLQAKITLEDHIPARAQYLQAKERFTNGAYQEFPELKDKTSAFYQQVQGILRQDPRLANSADGLWAAAIYQLGLQAHEARKAKSSQKASPEKPITAKPPASQTAAPAVATTKARTTDDVIRRKASEAESAELSKKGRLSQTEAIQLLSKRKS